jgi:hypothetical protein
MLSASVLFNSPPTSTEAYIVVGLSGSKLICFTCQYEAERKAPLRYAGHRPKRRHFAPVSPRSSLVNGAGLGAGEQTHAPIYAPRCQRVNIGFRQSVTLGSQLCRRLLACTEP